MGRPRRLTETERILALPAFWAARLIFFLVDFMAAVNFDECAESCEMTEEDMPIEGCQSTLLAIALFNFFALLALGLTLGIRWFSEERSYTEAKYVTYVLVFLEFALKILDVGLPVVVTMRCFPWSAVPPYHNRMNLLSCELNRTNGEEKVVNGTGVWGPWTPCAVGDLFATYSLYVLAKCGLGLFDLVLNTATLCTKPRDWYRLRR